jgi:hypothetical protein
MDTADPKFYWPISNLSVLSKLLSHFSAACLVLEGQRIVAQVSVSIHAAPFNRNRCAEGTFRHPDGLGQGKIGRSDTA